MLICLICLKSKMTEFLRQGSCFFHNKDSRCQGLKRLDQIMSCINQTQTNKNNNDVYYDWKHQTCLFAAYLFEISKMAFFFCFSTFFRNFKKLSTISIPGFS